MALNYLVEFITNDLEPQEISESAFFHIERNPGVSVYMDVTSKESFLSFNISNTLASSLFNIPGVVEVAITRYRVYITKSPVFSWEGSGGLIDQIVDVIRLFFNESSINELAGSRRGASTSIRRSLTPLSE